MRDLARAFLAYAGTRATIGAAVLMLVAAILEGLGLWALVPLLGVLTGQRGGRLQPILDEVFRLSHADTPGARLTLLLAGLVILATVRAIAILWRDRRTRALQLGFVEHLRLEMLRALGDAPWTQIVMLRHARVLNALTNDIQRVNGAAVLALQAAVGAVLLAAQFTVALVLSPLVAVLALALMLTGAWAMRPAIRRARRLGERVGQSSLAIVDTAAQWLGSLKLAAAQNVQPLFVESYAAGATAMTEQQLAYQRRDGTLRAAVSVGATVAGVAILLVGWWIEGPTPALAVTLVAIARTVGPAMLVQQNVQSLALLVPAYAAIAALLDDLAVPPAAVPARTIAPSGNIHLRNVSFAYGRTGGVAALNVEIGRGAVIGIVGPSGAGKTTLVDLLAGLLPPDEGEVRVGDTVLDDAGRAAWRNRVAYVGQDNWLMNASVRHNLVWGAGIAVDDAKLWATLEAASAAALVCGMPDGLDTEVAERGARLSGGERQRIALARALLRDPELLILDEATNAIDVSTERTILTRLVGVVPRPTIVTVAHRAETLACCERVLTMRDGRLVADQDDRSRPAT